MATKKTPSSTPSTANYSLRMIETRRSNSNNPTAPIKTGKGAQIAPPKKSNTAAAAIKASSRKRAPAAERSFNYKNKRQYRTVAGDRLDDKKVKRDNKAILTAQKSALSQLESRFSRSSTNPNPIINDPILTSILGLDRSRKEHDIYLSKMERRFVAALETEYPPLHDFASESRGTTSHWESVWYYTSVDDVRGLQRERPVVVQLDRSKMTVVPANQSIIFYDSEQPEKPVLFVKRGFVQNEDVKTAIGMMTLNAVVNRRGDRVQMLLFQIN
jgi:hypothetical protein